MPIPSASAICADIQAQNYAPCNVVYSNSGFGRVSCMVMEVTTSPRVVFWAEPTKAPTSIHISLGDALRAIGLAP